MSGTTDGAKQAVKTIYREHGKDFFKEIGQRGGRARVSKGFGKNPMLAREAGAKGGAKSRRGPSKRKEVSR